MKSIVFGKKEWEKDRKALFALTAEATKWSEVLSEVLEKSSVLKIEKQVSLHIIDLYYFNNAEPFVL